MSGRDQACDAQNGLGSGRLRVWAPRALRLELVLGSPGGERYPFEAAEPGWFVCSRALHDGEDYALSLDGGSPLPDPRSLWQPYGVHGFSRAVDVSRFAWKQHDFQPPPLERAVIYELHIGTFTPEGTFDGAIARLPYLRDLGVTHVEILPIAEFSGRRGWGYDGVYPFATYSAYGGPLAFVRFVDACHAHGLAVVLDVVYNHFGPEGNYVERYGPYLSPAATPWGAAVNLDGADCEPVRRYCLDNALMWLRDFRVDGLRLDAVDALRDQGPLHWLEELSSEVEMLESKTGRRCVLIAESDQNDPRMTRSRAEHGLGMTAQWNEEFHRSLHTALTPERAGWYADYHGLEDLRSVLRHGFAHRGRYSTFRRRRHGRALAEVPHHRCVAYLQTHDLVGNRPAGERLGQLVEPRVARLAAALLLLGPCVPMLFQGEEWNASTPFLYFTDHGDAGLGRAVLAGRKRDFAGFGWADVLTPDPQSESAYLRSCLQWAELDAPEHASFLSWYRRLIQLRQSWSELTAPARAELDASCLQLWREQSIAFFNFSSDVYECSLRELSGVSSSGPLEIVHAGNVEGEASSGGYAVGAVIESGTIRLGPFAFLLVRRSR